VGRGNTVASTIIFETSTASNGFTKTLDLTNVLPKDNYSYLCQFDFYHGRKDTSETNTEFMADCLIKGVQTTFKHLPADGVNWGTVHESGLIPIDTTRKLILRLTSTNNEKITKVVLKVYLNAYRRIGK